MWEEGFWSAKRVYSSSVLGGAPRRAASGTEQERSTKHRLGEAGFFLFVSKTINQPHLSTPSGKQSRLFTPWYSNTPAY